MVKPRLNENDSEIEITTDEAASVDEVDLEVAEASLQDIIKELRHKIKSLEAEKRELGESVQREKADFLNARRRLEEEGVRVKERQVIDHIERLLPLCDSFFMAMSDTAAWEKADPQWRKGIEGINSQLQTILASYRVETINPTAEAFDPSLHEAVSTEASTDQKAHNQVLRVLQPGYQWRRLDGTAELIRPARVIIGE